MDNCGAVSLARSGAFLVILNLVWKFNGCGYICTPF